MRTFRIVRSKRMNGVQTREPERFDISIPLKTKMQVVRDKDGLIIDYLDVTIDGYLSTFQNTTARDRDGDWVLPGAFTETLPRFLSNPVMLTDHESSVRAVVGSWIHVAEDGRGLHVIGKLSNAPDVQSLRFKIAEGHIRTLSMGGIFHFDKTGHGIIKVHLFEGSICPVPANPDALFHVRALSDTEKAALDRNGALQSFQMAE